MNSCERCLKTTGTPINANFWCTLKEKNGLDVSIYLGSKTWMNERPVVPEKINKILALEGERLLDKCKYPIKEGKYRVHIEADGRICTGINCIVTMTPKEEE